MRNSVLETERVRDTMLDMNSVRRVLDTQSDDGV